MSTETPARRSKEPFFYCRQEADQQQHHMHDPHTYRVHLQPDTDTYVLIGKRLERDPFQLRAQRSSFSSEL